MVFSPELEVLFGAGAGLGKPVSSRILLTSLRHVNGAALKMVTLALSSSGFRAFGLTVPHKTVAEPH
jgi:hypothetical protein